MYRRTAVVPDDGGLTVVYATQRPEGVPEENWLPTTGDGERFIAILRCYLHRAEVCSGAWAPPPLVADTR
ncbi:DUF1214 domain-containing protein [Isoptericola halotolerans]|uniref:DUF1214 domain-containing protein n=1 Tax=Isoptericola halotolerans TaxID=300560 RepID=UPI00388EC9C6